MPTPALPQIDSCPPQKRQATLLALLLWLIPFVLLISVTHNTYAEQVARADQSVTNRSETVSFSKQVPLQVVLMINNQENPFWQLVAQAATKAAADLNINLQVISVNGNPLRPVRVLSALVNSSRKPDAVLFPNIKNTGKAVLELLEKHKIYSVIYDNGFSPKDNMGRPGQYYRYWLGQIVVNNYEASRQLTHELIEEALQRFPDQRPLPMIVLEGNTASQANAQRLLGMFDALVSYKEQVEIRQIFHTRYDPKHAYNATLSAHQRYPEVRVIWAANDAMAIRVLDALKEVDQVPGRDVLVTGFDLLPEARKRIQRGELYNSYGGHFMSAAWGLIYLYDYLHSASERYQQLSIPLSSGKYPFKVAVPENGEKLWREPGRDFTNIDFTRFSRYLQSPEKPEARKKYLFEAGNNP